MTVRYSPIGNWPKLYPYTRIWTTSMSVEIGPSDCRTIHDQRHCWPIATYSLHIYLRMNKTKANADWLIQKQRQWASLLASANSLCHSWAIRFQAGSCPTSTVAQACGARPASLVLCCVIYKHSSLVSRKVMSSVNRYPQNNFSLRHCH